MRRLAASRDVELRTEIAHQGRGWIRPTDGRWRARDSFETCWRVTSLARLEVRGKLVASGSRFLAQGSGSGHAIQFHEVSPFTRYVKVGKD